MLDVAIGLTFIYALLSIVCSAAKELMEAQLKTRAKNLELGLREMLQDPEGNGACWQLWNHPLISGLFPGTYNHPKTEDVNFWFGTSNLPSYLPTAVFSRAFMNILFGDKKLAADQRLAAAQKDLEDINALVARAKNQPTPDAVLKASAAVTAAQAKLTDLEAQDAAVSAARAALTEAEASLAAANSQLDPATGQPVPDAVSTARAAVTEAQANLEAVIARTGSSTSASASDAVAGARAAVTQAQTELTQIEALIVVPFADLPAPAAVSAALAAVTTAQQNASLKSLIDQAVLNDPSKAPQNNSATCIQWIASVTQAVIDFFRRILLETKPASGPPKERDESLKKALKALADQASGDMLLFQKELEAWFDARMERLSGLYKRWTNLTLIGLGVFVAASMNVDTIAILHQLSTDDNLRKSVVEMAMAENTERNGALAQQRSALEIARTSYYGALNASKPGVPPTELESAKKAVDDAQLRLTEAEVNRDKDDKRAREKLEALQNAADKSRLAIGWQDVKWEPRKEYDWWLTKLFGIILTAIAISFGAPFWFDLLNQFISIRSALQPPVKTQQTTSTSIQSGSTQTTTTQTVPPR